jgi:tetratricopeptide (TPR) repeat protein
LVDAKIKVLIVIDNVHTEKTSKIFNVIKNLPTAYKNKNVLFLLAARQPEFKWMIERATDSSIVEKIEFLFDIKNENKKNNVTVYDVQYFSEDEIKGFIKKYEKDLPYSIKNKLIEENAKEIWKYTNGHPIMVRFSVFQNGLENHVESMYKDFLVVNEKPYSKEKIKVSIICSLFDISSIPITSNILKDLSLYKFALDLDSALLKLDVKTKTWKTIHPRWDLELLKYLFSITNLSDREDLDNCFSESIYSLLNLNDNKFNQANKIGIVVSIYKTIAINNLITIDKVDELLNAEEISQRFDNERKFLFFLNLSYYYIFLKKFDEAVLFSIKSNELDNKNFIPYVNKGFALSNIRKNEEAIVEYNKAIELNPRYDFVHNIKGNALSALGKNAEAIVEYDKVIELDPQNVDAYNNKGASLSALGKNEETIECYDKAIEINPQDVRAYDNKGYSLFLLGRISDAIELSTLSIRLDENYSNAWYNRSIYLFNDGRIGDALSDLQQAITIDVNYRNYALKDKDFDNMRNNPKFNKILKLK